jgi:hypothetical protein
MDPYNIINRLRKYPAVGKGFLEDASEYIDKFASKIGKYIPDVTDYMAAINDLTATANTLQVGLQNLSTLQEKQNANYLAGVKSATFLIEREKELAKTFGITANKSAILSATYSDMAKELKISTDLMNKYRVSLNKILPGMTENILRTGGFGKSLIRTNDLLQRHIGLTDEQTNSLTLAAAATGTDLETSVINSGKFAKAFEDATGEVGVFSDVMKSVANTSLDLRVEYSKFPGSLELATLKARRLGMSMEDIDQASKSLLDIESSIGKELEYQLISGKRLVDASGNSLTNKLREAKLANDAVGQANAMTEILTSQSEILEHGNYLQKQALADAVGLSVEQLQGANAQMKLQDQIYAKMKEQNKLTVNGKEIKSAVDLTMDDMKGVFDEISKTMTDKEKADAMANLQASQSQLTEAEKTTDYLKQIVDDGIRIKTGGGKIEEILRDSTVNLASSLENFTKATEYLRQPPEAFGKNQLMSEMLTGMVGEINNYIKAKIGSLEFADIDIGGKALKIVNQAIEKTYGEAVTPNETVKGEDAFMMHDGIIKFDDRDKFTMIASPYGAMHDSVADKIVGGNSNSLDANTIAKAIQTAIQAGLSNVSWAVNLDPMAVDKAIKFNSGRLNS